MKIIVLILHLLGCALVVLYCVCEPFVEDAKDPLIMAVWLEAMAIFFKLDIKQ